MAIQSFKCSETQDLFNLHRVRRWTNIEVVALRKLRMLHATAVLLDLRIPPGNRLAARANTASASTTSGACVLCGRPKAPQTWRSSITTDAKRQRHSKGVRI